MNSTLTSIAVSILLLAGVSGPLQAQDTPYTKPSWWFGVSGGANLTQYRGTTQILNNDLTVPSAFFHGDGTGLFVAPLIEFHRPDSRWGLMLQAGYDSRKGAFDQVMTVCNCPADLSTDLAYLTIEPSLRFMPFKGNLYLYAGPRFAFVHTKSFRYELGVNPNVVNQAPTDPVVADFGDVHKSRISMQVAAGYDMPLNSQRHRTQVVLSPFVAYHPQWGQGPRSVNTWDLATVRVGATLKLGRGSRNRTAEPAVQPAQTVVMPTRSEPVVTMTVRSPQNVPVQRRVRETFPLRNYVFFDLGSTQIPSRYVRLTSQDIAQFSEQRLETLEPKDLDGRTSRQMVVYHNILNILGDRMRRFPNANITLVGSSESGPADGRLMAGSVKSYLVDVFGIAESRIAVQGRDKPKITSEQPGATVELEMLRQEDRRVSVESSSSELLMEFQSGPNTPLRPVQLVGVQDAPLDSYITVDVVDAASAYTAWSLEIRDRTGKVVRMGPFTRNRVTFPGKDILGSTQSGVYTVSMLATTRSGKAVRKDTTVTMVLWTPPADEEGMRYNILYEFNNSEAIAIYNEYLSKVVAPKIPANGHVIIHGHTDAIGNAANNERLSLARANDVRAILVAALAQAGRRDVTFEVHGFGEDESMSPYGNSLPEERFYNRSVIIDILPARK